MLSNAQKIRNYARITTNPFTSGDVRKELDIPFQTIKNNLNILKNENRIKIIGKNRGSNVYVKAGEANYSSKYKRSWTPAKETLEYILSLSTISRSKIMLELHINGATATHCLNYLLYINAIKKNNGCFQIINPLPVILPIYRGFNEKNNQA